MGTHACGKANAKVGSYPENVRMPWGEQGGAEPPLGGRCRSGPAGCEAPAASPKDPGRGGPHPNKEWPWSECANPQPLPTGQWEKKEGRQGVGGGDQQEGGITQNKGPSLSQDAGLLVQC